MPGRAPAPLLGLCACIIGCRSNGGSTSGAPEPPPSAADPSSAIAPPPSARLPNALGLPAASVAAVVNPMNLPAYAGPTGTIEGTVLVHGPDAPDVPNLDVHACPAALDTYGKLFRAGARRDDGRRPLADAIVVVTGYSGFYLPEHSDVQRVTIGAGCGYPSRSIALTFGQRLDIANDSTVPFAPFLEGAPQFTVMVAPPQQKGEPVKIFPAKADYFLLRDQLQSFVRADVYVLRQPLHAISDAQGHFRIGGVPTGSLSVGARLAALGAEAVKDIDVQANAVQNVELTIPYAPANERSRFTGDR